MHVTLVNYEYPPHCGGGGRVTELLADGLETRDYTPHVSTDQSDHHYATFPLRSYRRLNQHLAQNEVDILHGHFSLPSSLHLPRLSRKHNLPLVVSVMGADIYDPTRFHGIRPLADRVNQHILDAADAVVAPSTDMQDRVIQKHNVNCQCIHYGIDPTAWTWQARNPSDSPTILSVCRLVDRKNLETAIRSVIQFGRHTGLDVTYRIVGTGPKQSELEARWGEFEYIEFAGYVDDLQSEFTNADVFFLPSKHEAFGMVFLEALATGLPVVTSATGGQTDIVNGTGITVTGDNPSAYAAALERLLDEYETFQRQTEGYVEAEFSQAQMVDAYTSLYQEVLA